MAEKSKKKKNKQSNIPFTNEVVNDLKNSSKVFCNEYQNYLEQLKNSTLLLCENYEKNLEKLLKKSDTPPSQIEESAKEQIPLPAKAPIFEPQLTTQAKASIFGPPATAQQPTTLFGAPATAPQSTTLFGAPAISSPTI